MEQRALTSGQAARHFNRSASWLKLLEYDGLIPAATRDFAGRRIYTTEDIARIEGILKRRRPVLAGAVAKHAKGKKAKSYTKN